MSTKQKNTYYSRHWLNKDKGRAYIEVEASRRDGGVEADVSIGDCGRSVTLDFSYYVSDSADVKTRKRAKQAKLDKLVVMIDELNDLYNFIEETE